MDITKVNIEQLPSGNIELTSKLMFGIGEFLHTDTAQNLLNLLGISTTNVRPKLVDLNITVLENDLDTFLASVNLTIAQGEIIFIRFFVIKNDSTLSRFTYTIPLGAGTYNPLGSTIVFDQLILVNEEFTGVSGNANTITYSFANLGEINASDPAIDFSDSEKEYIVILGTTPYLFIGDLGFYGVGELTMVIEDLQQIAINTFNLQINEEGETPISNVNRVEFANATVEDLGSGVVKVTGATPTLQEVTDEGNTTTNDITVQPVNPEEGYLIELKKELGILISYEGKTNTCVTNGMYINTPSEYNEVGYLDTQISIRQGANALEIIHPTPTGVGTILIPDVVNETETIATREWTQNAIITVELIDSLEVDFYATDDLKINSTSVIVGSGTITIEVNDSAYTLETLIDQGDKITVSTTTASVVNLIGKYE
jgi:hypothetical protein